MLRFEPLEFSEVPWNELDAFADRTIFQTRSWLDFIVETQGAVPVVLRLVEGPHVVGYFTGLTINRFGVRILGSPFSGWTTAYMGFNLRDNGRRPEALVALRQFAFKELGCHYVELVDRYLETTMPAPAGFGRETAHGFEIDLSKDEDTLFGNMAGACRRCIRKASKEGLRIVEANDDSFASEYHAQLNDVFAKQALVPTYNLERVQSLVKHLLPTGRLLLLRALAPDGQCAATGIFPAFNGTTYFYGGASWRKLQMFRPNEALIWYAMKYWKSRGMTRFDFGGAGDYKRKYGPSEIAVPRWLAGKPELLLHARTLARSAFALKQRLQGRLR